MASYRFRPWFRRVVMGVASATLLAGPAVAAPTAASAAAGCTRSPHLSGSFIQPWLPDSWSSTTWNTELGYLTNACITQQILQSTADTKNMTTVYPTSLPGYTWNASTDVVGRALTSADAKGVQEFIGLQDNEDWWTNYANNQTWLNTEATRANQIADELWSKYHTHPSFAGWYLTFEVDNVNLPTSVEWGRMRGFYATVANHLHSISGGKPVAIAPFYNSSIGLSPSGWQTMWTNILSVAPVDIIAPQDGIGAGNATKADIPAFFSATKSAIASSRPASKLYTDTETFTTSGTSMAISGVVADMKAAQPYVTGYWSFSYDHYDSPMQVSSSFDSAYRHYLVWGS